MLTQIILLNIFDFYKNPRFHHNNKVKNKILPYKVESARNSSQTGIGQVGVNSELDKLDIGFFQVFSGQGNYSGGWSAGRKC